MVIGGFQKMTAVDFPGTLACTVFTAGCDYRCPFCHNAPLVTPPFDPSPMAEADVLAYMEKRRDMLQGVCITGGEPLMQGDIAAFIGKVRALGYKVKIDTNGSYPDRLAALLDGGLVDYVAMDVKNAPARYAETVGLPLCDLGSVERSMALLKASPVPYELRTTVVRELHTPDDLVALARWIAGAPRYFLQPYRDSVNILGGPGFHSYSPDELAAILERVREYVPSASLRGA